MAIENIQTYPNGLVIFTDRSADDFTATIGLHTDDLVTILSKLEPHQRESIIQSVRQATTWNPSACYHASQPAMDALQAAAERDRIGNTPEPEDDEEEELYQELRLTPELRDL